MKYILLFITLITITGCETVKKHPFPNASPSLMESCPNELALVKDNTKKLSEVLTVVTKNYDEYHDCKDKVNLWKEWYLEQRQIHDKAYK